MPKLKTKRGAAKRFRRTSSGFKHRRNEQKPHTDEKAEEAERRLRGFESVSAADMPSLKRMLPKKAR